MFDVFRFGRLSANPPYLKVPESKRIRQSQGMDVYSLYTSASGEEHDMVKKVRLTTLAVGDVEAAIKSASSDKRAEEEREGSEQDDEDDEDVRSAVVSACGAPTLRRMITKLDLRSTPDTKKKKTDDSLAEKSTGKLSAIGGDDSDLESAGGGSTADQDISRLRKVCLTAILDGNRLGHKRRRLKELRDKFEEEKLTDPEKGRKATMFTERLSLAQAAEEISGEKWIQTAARHTLDAHIGKLKEHVTMWPSKIQKALLTRACCDVTLDIWRPTVSDDLMDILRLWPDSDGDMGDVADDDQITMVYQALDFDPQAPTLRNIDGVFKDKVDSFEQLFHDCFVMPLLRAVDNDRSKPACTKVLQDMCSVIAEAPMVSCQEDTESFGDACGRCMQALRCMLHLVDPSRSSEYIADFEHITNATVSDRDTSTYQVAMVPTIKSLPFWKQELSECKRTGATHMEAMEEATNLKELLDKCEGEEDIVSVWKDMVPIIPNLAVWAGKVRSGALAPLQNKVVDQVDQCASRAIADASKPTTSTDDAEKLMLQFASMHALISAAAKHLVPDQPRVKWQTAISTMEVSRLKLERFVSQSSFAPYIAELTGEILLEEQARSECAKKLVSFRSGRNPDNPIDDAVVVGITKVLDSLAVCASAGEPEEAMVTIESVYSLFQEFVVILRGGKTKRSEADMSKYEKVARILRFVPDGMAAIAKYEKLGESTDKRLEDTAAGDVLTQMACLRDLYAKDVLDISDPVVTSASKMSEKVQSMLDEAGPKLVDKYKSKIDGMLNSGYDPDEPQGPTLENVLGGTTTGAVWSDNLPKDASYKKCCDKAKKTMNQNKNSKLSEKLEMMVGLWEAVKGFEKAFKLEGDKEWHDKLDKSIRRGQTTIVEGLILYHCSSLKMAKLKSAILKEEQRATKLNINKDIHPAIITICSKAKKFEAF